MQLIEVREDLDNPDPKYSDLYMRMGERPDIGHWVSLASSFPSPPRVLELGCGAGGLAKPLARCGFEVWGVDIDPGMLEVARQANLPNLTLIQARVEEARLPMKFHLVILASHLINLPDQQRRFLIYSSAVAHLLRGGILALEVDDPEWHARGEDLDAGTVRLNCYHFDAEKKLWSGNVTYYFDDVVYLQHFTSQVLTVREVQAELEGFGLELVEKPVRRNHTDLELFFAFKDIASHGRATHAIP